MDDQVFAAAVFGHVDEAGWSRLQESEAPVLAGDLATERHEFAISWLNDFLRECDIGLAWGHFPSSIRPGWFHVFSMRRARAGDPVARAFATLQSEVYARFGFDPRRVREAGLFRFAEPFFEKPQRGSCAPAQLYEDPREVVDRTDLDLADAELDAAASSIRAGRSYVVGTRQPTDEQRARFAAIVDRMTPEERAGAVIASLAATSPKRLVSCKQVVALVVGDGISTPNVLVVPEHSGARPRELVSHRTDAGDDLAEEVQRLARACHSHEARLREHDAVEREHAARLRELEHASVRAPEVESAPHPAPLPTTPRRIDWLQITLVFLLGAIFTLGLIVLFGAGAGRDHVDVPPAHENGADESRPLRTSNAAAGGTASSPSTREVLADSPRALGPAMSHDESESRTPIPAANETTSIPATRGDEP